MALVGNWGRNPLAEPFYAQQSVSPAAGRYLLAMVTITDGSYGVSDSVGNAYSLAGVATGVALYYAPLTSPIVSGETVFTFSGAALNVQWVPDIGGYIGSATRSGSFTSVNELLALAAIPGAQEVYLVGAGAALRPSTDATVPTNGYPQPANGLPVLAAGSGLAISPAIFPATQTTLRYRNQTLQTSCRDVSFDWETGGVSGSGPAAQYGVISALFWKLNAAFCPGFPPVSLGLANGPWCLQTREGWYHEAYVSTGIRYRRSDFPTPPFAVNGRISSNTNDAEPRMALRLGKQLVLLFTRPTGDVPAVYRSTSDDDGATWSTPTLMFAGCKHPTLNVHPRSQRTLHGALKVTTTGRGNLYGSIQESGDASPGTEFKLVKTGGGAITVDDDTFHFAPAAESALRWTLVALDGGAIVRYYSTDDGRSWTLIP